MARLERLEEVLVVDDVAVVFVVAVEPVDAADGLEQAVVLHLLVDVEVGRGGASKPVRSLSTTISSLIWPALR